MEGFGRFLHSSAAVRCHNSAARLFCFSDSLKMSGFSTDPEIPASMEEQNPVIVWNSSDEGDL